jgi:hypothetical protein
VAYSGLFDTISRAIFAFDTSSITDSDTIDSATFSLRGTTKVFANGITASRLAVVSGSMAAPGTPASSDYGNVGSTEFASVTYAGYSTSAYNDLSLNASGLANITKTGITQFATRLGSDLDNDTSGIGTTPYVFHHYLLAYHADQSGTTNDPKLVVNTTAAAGGDAIPVAWAQYRRRNSG